MSNAIDTLLFDKYGLNEVHITPTVDSVVWRLNNTGVARLFMPYSDPLCTPERLALGNRALIRFASGLPDFGGVIDVPRIRTETGVRFSIYTADRILSWRQTAKEESFTSVSPGGIAQRLVQAADSTRTTGVLAGAMQFSSAQRTETYNFTNVLSAIQRLARQSGEEFVVLPVYTGGKLSFEFHWSVLLGTDLTLSTTLVEGQNIETPIELTEQGPIASETRAAGGGAGGSSWSDRLVGSSSSDASAARYGYREYTEIVTGVFDQATLDETADALLNGLSHSRKHFKVLATDKGPSPFDTYDIGDRVTVHAFLERGDWAFEGAVRVEGRSWDASNACRLEVIEWEG